MLKINLLSSDHLRSTASRSTAAVYQTAVLRRHDFERELIIAPHHTETYISYELLRLGLWCRRNRIKLVVAGSMNQLPFFSIFADEVVLLPGDLSRLFDAESTFGTDISELQSIPGLVDVYDAQCPELRASASISSNEVVHAYRNADVWIRSSSYELFKTLPLPRNAVCCEVKAHYFPSLHRLLSTSGIEGLIGLNKEFQRELLQRVGDHFMSIQLLASAFLGWRFIAAGGSVNLFNVLPINPLLLFENADDFNADHQYIARQLCAARYQSSPLILSIPSRLYVSPDPSADETFNSKLLAHLEAIATIPPHVPECAVSQVQHAAEGTPAPSIVPPLAKEHCSFTYQRHGYPDCFITLHPSGRILNGPGFNESSWRATSDTLEFLSGDGVPRVVMKPEPDGEYTGTFVNSGSPTRTALVRRPKRPLPHSCAIRLGGRLICWSFEFEHDFRFFSKHILPWALPEHERVAPTMNADFAVGVYLSDDSIRTFADFNCLKFLLACEVETRHPLLHRCFSFVQAPRGDDRNDYVRYAPTFCCWAPPIDWPKTRRCSAIDSGMHPWRGQFIKQLAAQITDVDLFGAIGGNHVGGYHQASYTPIGNEKYLAIKDYAFHIAVEREVAPDYVTEKVTDAIMCGSVPICRTAPNISDYFCDGSYILADEVAQIAWTDWEGEYAKRQPRVQEQRGLLRSRFNVFSYFETLTRDLSALYQPRPLTLRSNPAPVRGKKVLSFALFRDHKFRKLLPAVLRAYLNIYPGWEIRIHHDSSLEDGYYAATLKHLQTRGVVTLVKCPVAPLCRAMLWRLMPCWCEDVEICLCRDIDSVPLIRERCAVDMFIASGAAVHAMSDHPDHNVPLMGGMIGFKVQELQKLLPTGTWEQFLDRSKVPLDRWEMKGSDQDFLSEQLWPLVQRYTMEYRTSGLAAGESMYALNQVPLQRIHDLSSGLQGAWELAAGTHIGSPTFDPTLITEFFKLRGDPSIERTIAASERVTTC